MMKRFTNTKYSSKTLRAMAAVCLLFGGMQAVTAQFRVETFDEMVRFNVINQTNILGEPMTEGGNSDFVYDYLDPEIIAPNSGVWFQRWSGGNFDYEHRTAEGNSDGNYIGRSNTSKGGRGLYYVFNNSEGNFGATEAMEFDYRYNDPNSDQPNSMTASVIGMTPSHIGPQAAAGDQFYYDPDFSGGATPGGSVDNFSGRPRTPSGGNPFTPGYLILRDQDIDEVADWTSYMNDGSGQVPEDNAWIGGDEAFDWIIIGFSGLFFQNMDYEEGKDGFALDNIKLPMVNGKGDEVIPTIKRLEQIEGRDSLAMFSSEGGDYYLVPGGTPKDEASFKAAAVDQAVAYPMYGNYVKYNGLADGKYDIYIVDYAGNISVGHQINIGVDTYAPFVSVESASIYAGFDDIVATMDEVGTLKLVADGAGSGASAVLEIAADEKIAANLVVPGTVAAGQYDLYAIDEEGNVSETHIDITVEEPDVVAPVVTNTGDVQLIGSSFLEFTTDDPALFAYVVEEGTSGDLAAIQAAALETLDMEGGSTGSIAAVNLPQGFYIVYTLDRFGNFGTSGPTYEVLDITGPIASEVSSGDLSIGFPITATLNEDATVYVVPSGTAEGNIVSAAVITVAATGFTRLEIPTTGAGLTEGSSYDIYAIDGFNNWSELLGTITIVGEEVNIFLLGSEQDLELAVYPNPASSVIYVQSQEHKILEVQLIDLGGKRLLRSSGNTLNVENLRHGMYILNAITVSGKEFKRKVIVSD